MHAIRAQLASCAVAEALDDMLVRPQSLYWLTWWVRHLPGGLVWGFVAGKAFADVVYYTVEAVTRYGLGPGPFRLLAQARGSHAASAR